MQINVLRMTFWLTAKRSQTNDGRGVFKKNILLWPIADFPLDYIFFDEIITLIYGRIYLFPLRESDF